MAAGEGLAVLAVAAADHADHRDIAAQAMAHDGFIASGDALVCQLQVTERIILVHIDTCVIEHQVWLIEGKR